jgi:protein-disulfide isomerase
LSRNQLVLLGGAVGFVVLAIVVYFVFFNAGSNNADLSANAGSGGPSYTINPDDMTLGNPKAPVKVIEYGAPTCPVCAHFEMDNFDNLKKEYIDTGKVFFVFRVFPINGAADGAAEGLARCAGRTSADNYFHFIDLLFRNQKDWDPEYQPPSVHDGLLKMARVAGIEAIADKCMTDQANAQRINKVAKDGVDRYQLNATPTLIINGVVQQPGYLPWPTLKAALDNFLAKK